MFNVLLKRTSIIHVSADTLRPERKEHAPTNTPGSFWRKDTRWSLQLCCEKLCPMSLDMVLYHLAALSKLERALCVLARMAYVSRLILTRSDLVASKIAPAHVDAEELWVLIKQPVITRWCQWQRVSWPASLLANGNPCGSPD